MARLEAEVTANINPFERALSQAAHKAKEFAEGTKDVGKDIFKEVTGPNISKMLGLAGLGAAATAFGVTLVDTAKESLNAFGHMETQILRLKYNLQDPRTAKEVHEWIEQLALGEDQVDKLHDAFVSLSESGLSLDKSKEVLQDLQAVALKSGTSVDELAEAFRKAKAGGLDAGEGASRLLKSLPGLSLEIEKAKNAQAALAEEHVGTWDPAKGIYSNMAKAKAQAKELREMTPAEYVRRGLLKTENLEEMLHKMAPRAMVTEARGTLEGTRGRLDIVIDNLRESLGEGLAPAIETFTKDLSDNLPAIESSLKEFGKILGAIVLLPHNVKEHIGEFGYLAANPQETMARFLDRFLPPIAEKKEGPKAGEKGVTDIDKTLQEGNDLQKQTNTILEALMGFE